MHKAWCCFPVTLPKIRVNAWITHKIWLCVLVRREFDHFCWLTWWKITDELRKNYGKITHKSLTNHALQRIGTKRPQTGRMRGCAWRIRDGKPRIISALSLVNCVWMARMIHAWTAQRMRRRHWSCVHSAHIKLMRPRYVICSQCPNGDGIYTLLYALYKYSTSITNQPSALAFPFQQSQAAHRFFKFVKFSFFIRVRATWKEMMCSFVFQGHPSNVKVTWDKKHRFWPKLGVYGL